MYDHSHLSELGKHNKVYSENIDEGKCTRDSLIDSWGLS